MAMRLGGPLVRSVWAWTAVVTLIWPSMLSAQDWMVRRHDPQRLAYQPTGLDIDSPGVLQTLELGGAASGRSWLVADADRDGEDEVYLIVGGRLMSWSAAGTLLWATEPLGLTSMLGIEDLDEDGRLEAYVAGASLGPLAYDALSGDILWNAGLPSGRFVGDVLPVDVDGDGLRELLISDWGGPAAGRGGARVVRFPDGIGGPTAVTEFETSAHGYWFGLGLDIGGLTGDGRQYLVAASNDRIIAYDLATGLPAFTSGPLGDFPFGKTKLNIVDVDGDGRDEIVASSNNTGSSWPGAKRLMLLEVEAGELILRWELRADPALGDHRFIRDNVATLRAGDAPSIVTSIFDPGIGRWQTMLISGTSTTGAPYATIDDRVILALDDRDGDGVSDLLTMDAPGAGVPRFGTVSALMLALDDSLTSRWTTANAMLVTAPTSWRRSSAHPLHSSMGLILQLDTDGDGGADRVQYAEGATAAFRIPGAAVGGSLRAGSDRTLTDHIWLSMTDGRFARMDARLGLANDADGDGLADLRVGNYSAPQIATARGSRGMILATVDASGAPIAYVPELGSEAIWRARLRAAMPRPTLTWLPGAPPLLIYPAREADGTLALVTLDGESGVERGHVSLGTEVSTIVLNDVLPLRTSDDTVEYVVVGLLNRRSGRVTYTAVDPMAGAIRSLELSRQLRSGEYPLSAHDVDADGMEDALVIQIAQLRIASGATGAELARHTNPRFGGMLSYVDLDGDGILDVLHQGGAFGINATSPGFGVRRLTDDLTTEVWSFDQDHRHQAAALAPVASGGFRIGMTRQREAWFGVLDAAGILQAGWVPAGGRSYADILTAEAEGEEPGIATSATGVASASPGRSASFVFGSSDGYLYAAHAATGELAWSLPFRTAVGEPIASDVTGDGQSEIIVPAGDGNIYIVGPARLDAPAAVYDNDGENIAGSAAADIDELPRSSRVGADWTEVTGATGYEYQLIRDDDLIVVPWVDVGRQTHASVDGLSLDVGPRYFSLVRAYNRGGRELRVSPEVRSDGFVILDDDGPTVTLTVNPELFWRVDDSTPTSTQIQLLAADAVGLRDYRLSIESLDGRAIRAVLAGGPAAGVERIVDASWPGRDDSGEAVEAGVYTVVGIATDLDGRSAETRASVTVCTADAPAALGCALVLPDAGARDSGTPGTLAGGGGCGCRVADSSPTGAEFIFAAVAALLWLRRRRR